METRIATAADAASLAALHAESFGAACWSLAQIADSLALATTKAWVIDAQGFILCQFAEDETEILTFCVSPAMRRKGAGRWLLAVIIAEAQRKNISRIFLEVAVDNQAAITLYEQAGFRIIGKRAGYYRRGAETVDAVMLSLST